MDILGFPMEDWDEGQLVGAFVLSSDMEPVETAIRRSSMETIYVAVPLALICQGVLFYVLQKAVVNPLGQSLGDTIADVAGLSSEEGMGQITAAVTDIDEVIQSSAAGAEETSSTIHEVNEQIAALRDVVGKLAKLSGKAKSEMESANYGSAAHAGPAANDHVGSFEHSTSANFFAQHSGNPDESGDVGFFETQPHANGNRLRKDPALFS